MKVYLERRSDVERLIAEDMAILSVPILVISAKDDVMVISTLARIEPDTKNLPSKNTTQAPG